VVAIGTGIAVRVWILRSTLLGGYFDSDEAVPGLMARHFLHGEFSTFYWGQAYGGTTEVALIAALFGVVGSSVLALRLVPMTLYAVGAVLLWRIGRRTIREPGATVAALLFWIAPAYFVFRSTRETGYQGALLVLGLAALLFALRLAERPTRRNAVGLGLALGLGWWTSIQIALVGLPVLVWLGWRRPKLWRLGWLIAAAAYVGAFPWLVWNFGHHWQSLHVASSARSSYGYRLAGFFTDALPTALGLRVPWLLQWLPTPTLGKVLFAMAVGGLVFVLLRGRRSLGLVAAVALPYPFIYAASSFTADRLEPRYLVLLAPLLALLLAALIANGPLATLGLGAAALLAVVALVRIEDAGGIAPGAPDVRAPARLGPLLRTLEREHVTRAWADYWIAFRVTFVTHERIIVAPTYSARYPRYNQLVGQSTRSAYIFVAGTASELPQRSEMLRRRFRRIRTGDFVVYVPPPSASAAP
jgi:Dolichyl-phosphate-mannose-protein mannosyltransferase